LRSARAAHPARAATRARERSAHSGKQARWRVLKRGHVCPLWRMAERSAGDCRLAIIQLETSRQRVAKRPVNRKGTSFTYHQQPMNRITLVHPPSFDSQARTEHGSSRRNTACTEVRPDSKRTWLGSCNAGMSKASVIFGFGSRGVCRSEDLLLKSGPELQSASRSSHARGLRRPACAYVRPSCHANPIR
jgi:hypothetical protein